MQITAYFAKLNLITKTLYDLYDGKETEQAISSSLLKAILTEPQWTKENSFMDEDGEERITVITYRIKIIRRDENSSCIEGYLYKDSKLHYKQFNEDTKLLDKKSIDNTEAIRFVLDIKIRYIAYNTVRRFGYQEFADAFCEVINSTKELSENEIKYNMAICNEGIGLEEIKKELKTKGKLRELKIRVQPPNPSEELLKEIKLKAEERIDNMKDANVNVMEVIYRNNDSDGLNLDSTIISDSLEDTQNIHSKLSLEEATMKGYIEISATSVKGEKFASGDRKPVKIVIPGVEDFFEYCKDRIQQFF